MSVEFYEIYTRFNDNFSELEVDNFDPLIQKSLLRNSFATCIVGIKQMDINYELETIQQDCTEVEINIISRYMFDEYLAQEIRKYNKVVNISSDIVKITGLQDRVKNLRNFREDNAVRIEQLRTSLL